MVKVFRTQDTLVLSLFFMPPPPHDHAHPQYVLGLLAHVSTHVLFPSQKLYRRYVVKRNQRKRQREEDLKKEEKKSSEKRSKTNHETITGSVDNPGGSVKITNEGEEKMSTDQSANVHAELSKVGQIKLGTDHPIANHGEPAKEGDENTSTDHSEAVLDKPAADANMEEEDPEYEEDPEEIEIYEDDEDMDDAHAEEQIAEQVIFQHFFVPS
jgi:hypothetical protein